MIAPLNAARTAQPAIPTLLYGYRFPNRLNAPDSSSALGFRKSQGGYKPALRPEKFNYCSSFHS
jgi:hypothetical protein